MSVQDGENLDALMLQTIDYLYRVRMDVYTRQKKSLAKRLDVMPDGPDRIATQKALKQTSEYLKYLKGKIGKL